MKKKDKIKDPKVLEELKRLDLFEKFKLQDLTEEGENLSGGVNNNTTVDPQWPTTGHLEHED